MPDVEYVDGVVSHALENSEWIPNDSCYPDLRAARFPRRSFGGLANTIDDIADFLSDGFGDDWTGIDRIIS